MTTASTKTQGGGGAGRGTVRVFIASGVLGGETSEHTNKQNEKTIVSNQLPTATSPVHVTLPLHCPPNSKQCPNPPHPRGLHTDHSGGVSRCFGYGFSGIQHPQGRRRLPHTRRPHRRRHVASKANGERRLGGCAYVGDGAWVRRAVRLCHHVHPELEEAARAPLDRDVAFLGTDA